MQRNAILKTEALKTGGFDIAAKNGLSAGGTGGFDTFCFAKHSATAKTHPFSRRKYSCNE
jgi:hypothetical protein